MVSRTCTFRQPATEGKPSIESMRLRNERRGGRRPLASAAPVGGGGLKLSAWSVGRQKVSFQLLSLPVSAEATSWTRSFHVPLAVSLEALTV